jgi:hypothetical protein
MMIKFVHENAKRGLKVERRDVLEIHTIVFCCFCSRIISDILLRGLVPDSDFGGILRGCNWEDVIGGGVYLDIESYKANYTSLSIVQASSSEIVQSAGDVA